MGAPELALRGLKIGQHALGGGCAMGVRLDSRYAARGLIEVAPALRRTENGARER